ncbi:glycosyltransferase [Chryseobacterium culicis]|uniref:Rhamnosyltransferase n=1 Tax=Chryseobacterium culicis TaxID=680127 RepID=A0A1H6H373_CHRCI|nr:glycosyltransferase [Chryseobacterium culicis]MBE4947643.1 glycosyltransferase [Chryseobacterium culicis]SEH28648.1 rhamnosyltransferase [Chryseobacterium culicis]
MKKVIVLISTYNGENFIREQMDSILMQQDVEIEIHVSDDNSRDNTVNIIKSEYSDKISNLNINKIGTGAAAKNFLQQLMRLSESDTFDYVALSDQDDIWNPRKMIAAVEALEKSNSKMYASNLTIWNNSDNSTQLFKKDFPQKKYDYLFEGGSAGCTYVLTRDIVLELQQIIKNIDYSEWPNFSHDWLLYFLVRNLNEKVFIDGNPYINYRIHDQNVHGHMNTLSVKMIKERTKLFFNGWYHHHALHYKKLLQSNSLEYKILDNFTKSYFSRMGVLLKYNFQLMRDNKKFLMFFFFTMINFKTPKDV